MNLDSSLEVEITEGKIAIIRDFIINFNEITITFENSCTGHKKTLTFSRVIGLTMEAHCGEEHDSNMGIGGYETLIGISVLNPQNPKKPYYYEMLTDDYIFGITCFNLASLCTGVKT